MSELEFYSDEDMQREPYARILLTGAKKIGKSTSIYTTAPGPIVALNADGRDALMPAKRYMPADRKGLINILDITCSDVWRRGADAAIKLALDGKCKTIVVDTFSVLVNHVLTLEHQERYRNDKDKYATWRAVLDDGMRYFQRLTHAPAHVIFVCHLHPESGQLVLNSQLQETIPALINDVVLMEAKVADNKVSRTYRIGPDVDGICGGRFAHENKVLPADVTLLLKELQYNV